jgi:hypothetical protein
MWFIFLILDRLIVMQSMFGTSRLTIALNAKRESLIECKVLTELSMPLMSNILSFFKS